MDKNKIIELLKYADKKEEKSLKNSTSPFSPHTNPIVERMLLYNIQSKKNNFKDFFK